MPSLRSSTIAALRPADRVGGERQRVGHPVRLSERFAVAQDAVMARCRLDRQPDGFEAANWLGEPDPHANPMGTRGVGEIGIVGAAAAIANAVHHATGRRVRRLPITLDQLL
jgi:hypothetical protein